VHWELRRRRFAQMTFASIPCVPAYLERCRDLLGCVLLITIVLMSARCIGATSRRGLNEQKGTDPNAFCRRKYDKEISCLFLRRTMLKRDNGLRK
jgi:hypothetical protein